MNYSLQLNKDFQNRIIFPVHLKHKIPIYSKILDCVVDTGCFNTLIPYQYTQTVSGSLLESYQILCVGNKKYKSQMFVVKHLTLGDFKVNNVLTFASNYEGLIKDKILLGLNFLNNLKYTISRNGNTFDFEEDIWELYKKENYPYLGHFDDKGNPSYLSNIQLPDNESKDTMNLF